MKITAISVQQRNPERVNISIDGAYRFSLNLAQLADYGLKTGQEISEAQLAEYEEESAFGKLYMRALEYCLLRPHSAEARYLWRKTRPTRYKSRRSGEQSTRPGVSRALADRVFDRLIERGHIDDEAFARYWATHRNQTKGASRRKLQAELAAKGVVASVIEQALAESERSDLDELYKVLEKSRAYDDNRN